MDGRFSKESGPIGFLSQTGTGLVQLVSEANARGLRFSKAVSLGNAVDLDAPDFLDYFASDEETKIILVYVEGISKNGRRFFQTLRECNKVKPGRTLPYLIRDHWRAADRFGKHSSGRRKSLLFRASKRLSNKWSRSSIWHLPREEG
jgi:hypothetical protein